MSGTNAIVECARGWLGTRFHHQGRVKKSAGHKGGVDCLGLLVGVAAELDLRSITGMPLAHADEVDYSHHPDSARLQKHLSYFLRTIPSDEIAAGDVLLLKIENNPQHLGIVTARPDGLGVIHAYAPARSVVEHTLDRYWLGCIAAAFRI